MNPLKEFLQGKGWLIFGSIIGGVLGALTMHLNYAISPGGGAQFAVPLGMGLSVVLGMIGGIVGGVFGSFISGLYVHENAVLNVGASLGVGLVNGFVCGTIVGILLGATNEIWPALLHWPVLLGAIAIVLAISASYLFLKRR